MLLVHGPPLRVRAPPPAPSGAHDRHAGRSPAVAFRRRGCAGGGKARLTRQPVLGGWHVRPRPTQFRRVVIPLTHPRDASAEASRHRTAFPSPTSGASPGRSPASALREPMLPRKHHDTGRHFRGLPVVFRRVEAPRAHGVSRCFRGSITGTATPRRQRTEAPRTRATRFRGSIKQTRPRGETPRPQRKCPPPATAPRARASAEASSSLGASEEPHGAAKMPTSSQRRPRAGERQDSGFPRPSWSRATAVAVAGHHNGRANGQPATGNRQPATGLRDRLTTAKPVSRTQSR